MSATIQASFPIFLDLAGKGLNNGAIYIGQYGKDPELYPLATFWDFAGLVSAAQPLTTLGGYITRAGTPTSAYVSASYSIRVRDTFGNQVYYNATAGVVTGTGAGSDTPFDVSYFRSGGSLLASEVQWALPAVRSFAFPIDFAGSLGNVVGVPPAIGYTMTLRQNGTAVGTIAIASTGLFTFSTFGVPITIALNDVLVCTGGTADTALADWGFVLKGSRT